MFIIFLVLRQGIVPMKSKTFRWRERDNTKDINPEFSIKKI